MDDINSATLLNPNTGPAFFNSNWHSKLPGLVSDLPHGRGRTLRPWGVPIAIGGSCK